MARTAVTAMNYQIVPKALSWIAVFLVLLVGFVGASDSAERSKGAASPQKPKRPIMADCLEALQVADSFLWAWVNRDEGGIKLVTDRLIADFRWARSHVSYLL